ncbi:MAG: acetylxylan esterase [Eubacteriales bacterium]|nr:acetylxylan esterase [Eubacteriales bacterium]
MPIVDMSVEKLYAFTGCNPCPADIEEYWDRAIAQMEALGTECELVPAAFRAPGVECYDLYFTGVGGARIHCRFAKPAHAQGKLPGVCLFHGYTGCADSFSGLMKWCAAGMAAASMDCRGQGGSSEDIVPVKGNTHHGHIIRGLDDPDPDKLYFRNVFLDTAQLARIMMAMDCVDETKVGATGGSQGGGLTLACAALTPGLNRAAPVYPFLCDYRRVWDMDLDVAAYAELREFFRHSDPRHEREEAVFTKLGYIDNQHIAHRIRARVLMCTGLLDTVCPPSSQFAAYNKITAQKEVLFYPDFGHENLPESDDIILQFLCGME